eukprot:GAHX01002707.1.p1 GENE.GAHX01002707.1~~GAHX01002707.1.p1  ORF type:complete len:59 (-),score=8.37 GAHX01002707.1:247-423(-)
MVIRLYTSKRDLKTLEAKRFEMYAFYRSTKKRYKNIISVIVTNSKRVQSNIIYYNQER